MAPNWRSRARRRNRLAAAAAAASYPPADMSDGLPCLPPRPLADCPPAPLPLPGPRLAGSQWPFPFSSIDPEYRRSPLRVWCTTCRAQIGPNALDRDLRPLANVCSWCYVCAWFARAHVRNRWPREVFPSLFTAMEDTAMQELSRDIIHSLLGLGPLGMRDFWIAQLISRRSAPPLSFRDPTSDGLLCSLFAHRPAAHRAEMVVNFNITPHDPILASQLDVLFDHRRLALLATLPWDPIEGSGVDPVEHDCNTELRPPRARP